ncbi:uncharacterized protein LOC126650314 isoform X2 [Myiozetetes cayanensis]|uniref:uncharacterized protein LOC126650314 isoform X2 n=1 Tax=Myiozetetes cayanensis TaxID=478635 RepID=UPI0021600E7D|nr:uncharacterized protein LOC126650314 isoform X2 [Myiozetetes cayanensis]XP_050190869.1 uncharacterized protein LOC126650314 isoform X2 [Myiozetetes cayanensis]XP_050190870.1 uncharacterized protein LOC126650314 isoform X2 [Myiozetetes cayanensis]
MIHAVSEPPSAPARPTAAPDAAAQLPAAPAPSLSGSCARGWRGGSLPLWCGAAPLSPQHRGRLVGRGLGSPASAAPQKPARQERLRLAGPQLRGRTAEIARGGGGIAGTRPRWGWLHHSRGATRHGRCGRGPLSVRPSVRPSVLPSPPAAAGDGRRTALPLRIGSLGRAGLHRAASVGLAYLTRGFSSSCGILIPSVMSYQMRVLWQYHGTCSWMMRRIE